MTVKLCIDCKHFRRSTTEGMQDNMEYAKCGVAGKLSLVDGKRPLVFCSSARSLTGACGEEGKLFQLPEAWQVPLQGHG